MQNKVIITSRNKAKSKIWTVPENIVLQDQQGLRPLPPDGGALGAPDPQYNNLTEQSQIEDFGCSGEHCNMPARTCALAEML